MVEALDVRTESVVATETVLVGGITDVDKSDRGDSDAMVAEPGVTEASERIVSVDAVVVVAAAAGVSVCGLAEAGVLVAGATGAAVVVGGGDGFSVVVGGT